MWLSKFHTYMTLLQNYADRKQKSYKIMKMQLLATQDKAEAYRESVGGLNLAAVRLITYLSD